MFYKVYGLGLEGGGGGGCLEETSTLLKGFIIFLPIVSGVNEFEFAQVRI